MPARGQFKDRSGETIGNRKLLRRDYTRGMNDKGRMREPYYWNKCITCGYESSNGISSINKVKDSKQCTKCMNRLHQRVVDVKGEQFHNWTVISHTRRVQYNGPKGSFQYVCDAKCICNKVRTIPVHNLIRGLSKSCGCIYQTLNGLSNTPEGKIFGQRRSDAKKKGIPFTITIEDIKIPKFCPVLGIKIEPGQQGDGLGIEDNSPSLDKFVPSKGYVPGNVAVISWRANCLKRDATADELQKVADWMRKQDNNSS